jgi:hypothetical protein
MRAKYVVIGVVLGVLLSSVVVVLAGNLDPPSAPTDAGSQMPTLEQIYQRLDTGAAGTKMTSFTEPLAGPGSTMHTLDKIMDMAPAADNTNGAAPGDVLTGRTFWGLRTDGTWGNRTGTRVPAPVPKTRQTYDNPFGTREDGELQMGVTWPDPRFTENVDNNGDGDCQDPGETCDGTVTDNLTGLIWLEDASCADLEETDGVGRTDWIRAISATNVLADGTCGLSDGSVAGDWRLPNVRELHSLIDFEETAPALPDEHPFSGVTTGHYWSSTCHRSVTDRFWRVDLNLGGVHHEHMDNEFVYVWPVRGGP